ncbi:noncanonical pyrimidine nucleotidase, YjjG family [Streptococcus cuniculi]|uniref:Noncanonical pyrimidine nucleotidase, YjjG family n=1 Tax=Streptococcus cuniculi TaxID=1432788 RepID=A0A1Q8E7Y3_9STRE|nr:YjjG family noncanonical pyrimidine nucleotidase [Streptococcus cuniculi]OLF47909.1 noncanonical pyrimidine nucleotidase, YjjG family [Streptococcus cuniculi]
MYYRFLLFDLDHTLLDFAAAEELALTQFLEAMAVEDMEAFKAYYKPMNQAMWKELEQGNISKPDLINTRFARAFAHFGREVDGREMALLYQDFISQQGQIFEGAVALLQELLDQGYELYGATNGVTYIQENRLAHSSIQPFFKDIFISEQMGTKKPEALFYEKIAEQISGFTKEQALMIGDSLTADVQGGNNAGIDTVWYNPDSLENHTSAQPTYQVQNYQELLALLAEHKSAGGKNGR